MTYSLQGQLGASRANGVVQKKLEDVKKSQKLLQLMLLMGNAIIMWFAQIQIGSGKVFISPVSGGTQHFLHGSDGGLMLFNY